MTIAATLSMPTAQRRAWTPALLLLGAGLGLFGAAFAEEVGAAIDTWERSTAYNHCWLVLPVAIWLGWTRLGRLAGLRPAPSALLALLAIGPACAWLAAERLGIMEGRQLAALALAEVLVLAVLGWRICRVLAAPLVYLVFLVPFGAFLVPALQHVTARMITVGLQIFGIPHYVDDLVIEIPAGVFLVAEACAGLRFFIAALAFGTLYALVMFRSPWRRLAVLGLALVVPVLANGARALGIVLLGHHLGSAEAAAADHLIYGWAFFSVVILLLVLAGLPFRQDGEVAHPPPPLPPAAPRGATALAAAAGLAAALGLLAPGLMAAMGGNGVAQATALPAPLIAPEGCATAAGGGLRCAETSVTARLVLFSPRANWSAVAAERRRLAGEDDEDVTFGVADSAGSWRARQSSRRPETVAVASWLGGHIAGDGLRSRAEQAWNSLSGGGGRPVVALVTLRTEAGAAGAAGQLRDRALLRLVLEAQQHGLAQRAAQLSQHQ
ncbi:exosortase A [Humitalea rosea]|uniref:Exosortase A n=1 Tax=Humitalea rosea TaxID=990373 RepID=A0A2W7ILB8_9PROT|nr:exosortase A [Humitalea rosea]PZW46797.1 exosortase A [Humitalea rosea]